MIADFIVQLGPWAWVLAGILLLGLEILAPGNIFVWFGVAAILTGVLALLGPFGWQTEAIVFVVLAGALVLVGRRVFSRQADPGERPFLNDRSARLVGTTHLLTQPIVDGKGRIRVDDTNWRVRGPDMPSGVRVRVAAADGADLRVERVDDV